MACLGSAGILGGCASTAPLEDPVAVLRNPSEMPFVHRRALEQLDEAGGPDDPAYRAALHRIIWVPGYTQAMRMAAFERLERDDPEGLLRTLAEHLPRMAAWEARRRYCEIIAERGWTELSVALALSWSQPVVFVTEEHERPEYIALAALHGEARVIDEVFDLVRTRNRPAEAGLRARLFELLYRIGAEERLRELLLEARAEEGDLFLLDLQAALTELGMLPRNSEEILWLRRLREPSRATFWEEAVAGAARLSAERRHDLEIRDLATVVAAERHRPDLLERSDAQLLEDLTERLRGARHTFRTDNFNNANPSGRERLQDHRGELTWGDLAIMHLTLDAMSVPQVVAHLFDFAERDRLDRTTEYGGIIRLDTRGRFEVVEFPPERREHDQKFIASQAMLDAGYTGLLHFHFHAQRHDNARYAGPGHGDFLYADNLRVNCIVLTFVARGRMNIDFYRHGRITVDLGEIRLGGDS